MTTRIIQVGYFEPERGCTRPVVDDLTRMATFMLRSADPPLPFDIWMGVHTCVCGAESSNCDRLLNWTTVPDGIFMVNSLLVHYVSCHRAECPLDFLQLVVEFYEDPDRDDAKYAEKAHLHRALLEPTESEIAWHDCAGWLPRRRYFR